MYRGRGDYVAGYGDPGIFGFLGSAVSHILPMIPGGGVISTALGAAGKLIGAARSRGASMGSIAAAGAGLGVTGIGQSMALSQARRLAGARLSTGTLGGHITKPIAGTLAGTPHGAKLVGSGGGGGPRRRRGRKVHYTTLRGYRRRQKQLRRSRGRRMTAKQRRYFGKRRRGGRRR